MNYLAHILLSCEDEALLVGNFLGDHLHNKELAAFPEAIQQGVRLHRFIDSYTDNHPEVRNSIRLLQPKHGKYAGVVVDVLYDFILAREWQHYGSGSLQDFANTVYEILLRHLPVMPERVQRFVPLMVADNWLVRYGTWEGIDYTFERMRKRASQPQWFDNAVASLQEHEAALSAHFSRFFPDISKEVKTFCHC
ncbi:MAG: ACP phosphodiesterase [Saprospiraceae bacterium]